MLGLALFWYLIDYSGDRADRRARPAYARSRQRRDDVSDRRLFVLPRRGFLTAVLRTKLGLTLVSEKTGEVRVYRIVANDVSPKRRARSGRKAA